MREVKAWAGRWRPAASMEATACRGKDGWDAEIIRTVPHKIDFC